jgi:DNA-binding NarL/FixJ family response regulator
MLPESNEVPRLLLADDHAMLRDGLRAILTDEGFEVVAEASDGREAVRLAQSVGADVAVLDVSMPLLNGIEAAREILKSSPKTRIILLTMYSEDRYFSRSVAGIAIRLESAASLGAAIHAVRRGEVYLCPDIENRCRGLLGEGRYSCGSA